MTDNVVPLKPAPPAPVTQAVPEFIQPHDMRSMSDEELDALIAGMRERRLRMFHQWEASEREKREKQTVKVRLKLDKKWAQIDKAYAKANDDLDKLEKLIFEYRALRMQLE